VSAGYEGPNRYGGRSYSLKVDMVKTPPMIPESIPNNIPPKQACLHQQMFKLPSSESRAYRASQHKHAPSVDLWRILLDGIVVNDSVEEAHVVGRSFCRAQTERLEVSGGTEVISRMRNCFAFKLSLPRGWRSRPHRDQGRHSWNNGFSPSWFAWLAFAGTVWEPWEASLRILITEKTAQPE
jgi:hypothetical protein